MSIPHGLAMETKEISNYLVFSDRVESKVMKGSRKIPIHFFRKFPSGVAGLGLFLLRVITALTLSYVGYSLQEGSGKATASLSTVACVESALLALLGVLMIVGFATLITGICSWALLIISWRHAGPNGLSVIAAALSLVVMLVGPGAYSLDSRLFGWRRVEIVRRASKPKP
jgi:putative oxidoreductase